jgi:hypothetical protein
MLLQEVSLLNEFLNISNPKLLDILNKSTYSPKDISLLILDKSGADMETP